MHLFTFWLYRERGLLSSCLWNLGVFSERCTEKLPLRVDFIHRGSVLPVYVFVFVIVAQLCLILCNPMDYSPPSSSVHGISQARILEWVTISFPRGSFQPRDWTVVSCIAGRFFTIWATRGCPRWYLLKECMNKWVNEWEPCKVKDEVTLKMKRMKL